MQYRWDIFCTVIDNYGDIGICWRLARQLVDEHHQIVRLWVDNLARFSCLAPSVNPRVQHQIVHDVKIYDWKAVSVIVEPVDIMIEAFACELPDDYMQTMQQKIKQPIWINLEYLSAESWVAQYHALPSPHPQFLIPKTCFFPGFTPQTGGLLRERDLIARRNAFNTTIEYAFFKHKGLRNRKAGEIRISLFCYDTAPVKELIYILLESSVPILIIVPEGKVAENTAAILSPESKDKKLIKCQQLTVQIIPFMEQADYDLLLWSCDVNFVRGEDSFLRAQWGASPFIWNIYPQSEGVHWKKLDAFLDLYTVGMPKRMSDTLREIWNAWNNRNSIDSSAWMNFLSFHESLRLHNKSWVRKLLKQNDLASNLVQFTKNRL